MKRFIVALLLTNCLALQAQHRPLKNINIADAYLSQSGSEKSYNTGNTREIYAAYFYLGKYRIEHQKGIKDYDLGYDLWSVSMRLDSEDAIAIESYASMEEGIGGLYRGKTILKVSVGESVYSADKWYYSPEHSYLTIDLSKPIAEHISISGFQAINVDNIEIIHFTDIEQGLWQRSAKDVLKY